MPAVVPPARPFRAATGLAVLGASAAYGVGLSVAYTSTGLALPCPLRLLTGWQCPLCGGTRLGAALLHGDLPAAFAFNPLVLLGLVVASVLGVLWAVEAVGGPAVRPPAALAAVLRRAHPNHWLVAGLLVGAAYVVLRNLV